mgnify:CR=1 FL=1
MKTSAVPVFLAFIPLLLLPSIVSSQVHDVHEDAMMKDYARLKPWFEAAYSRCPEVTPGLLEAVSYSYTRFSGTVWADTSGGPPHSIPRNYTVMGLTLDGKGYFRENMRYVSRLSGIPVGDMLSSDSAAIMAYALSLRLLSDGVDGRTKAGKGVEAWKPALAVLSEIPESCALALNSSLYVIYRCLSDSAFAKFGIPFYEVDFRMLFGEGLEALQGGAVRVAAGGVGEDAPGAKGARSADYHAAIWNPAPSCNYSSRNGMAVQDVTVHYTAGTYAGAIAWFQNCSAGVSAHYVIRSMDGQVAQMVRESDKAWHVGSANGYTIGIEHEAYGNVAAFFTPAMYASSAALVRDICARHPNIDPLHVFYRDTLDDGTALNSGLHSLGGSSACTQIRGHQHFPGQTHTDPGPYWNWNLYYKLINPVTVVDTATGTSGSFVDSGGPSGDYGNNERRLFLIHAPGADSIVMEFSEFQLEDDYDFLWMYAGADVFSPLLGRWNTRSPGRVVAVGGDLLAEFRSDCSGVRSGWQARWTAYGPATDTEPPTTRILAPDTSWVTGDFTAHFRDSDDVSLQYRFFQLMESENGVWSANPAAGFFADNFDSTLSYTGWTSAGGWGICRNALAIFQPDSPAWVSAPIDGSVHGAYLFDFYLSMDADSGKCTFVFDADASWPGREARFLAVTFSKGDNTLTIWHRGGGEVCTLKIVRPVYYPVGQKALYRIVWDRADGKVMLFRHSALLAEALISGAVSRQPQVMGFLSEGASVTIDNLRVYGSRSDTVKVTVGGAGDRMVRRQADHGAPTCKIKSVVMDGAAKFSALQEKSLRVDYTPPLPPRGVSAFHKCRSIGADMCDGVLQAEWGTARDEHSGIRRYCCYIIIAHLEYKMQIMGSVGGATTTFAQRIRLPSLSNLWFGVSAENEAGLSSHVVAGRVLF